MRTTLTAAVAVALIAGLTACAPQSREDQAKQMFRDFVAMTTGGPVVKYCGGPPPQTPKPVKIDESVPFVIKRGTPPYENSYQVTGKVVPADERTARDDVSTVQTRFNSDGSKCVETMSSLVW